MPDSKRGTDVGKRRKKGLRDNKTSFRTKRDIARKIERKYPLPSKNLEEKRGKTI